VGPVAISSAGPTRFIMNSVEIMETSQPANGATWAQEQARRDAVERASAESIAGNMTSAIELLRLATRIDPGAPLPWPFLAAFQRAVGDAREDASWRAMAEIDRTAAVRAQTVVAHVDRFLDTRVVTEPEALDDNTVIWQPGFLLNADATPQPRLLRRLTKTVELATRFPAADVLVSGGRLVVTPLSEASVMASFLISHGVDEHRILAEHCSLETLENTVFARGFLEPRHPHVVVASEEPHLARAAALLDLTGWAASVTCVAAAPGDPLAPLDVAAIYRDCLRLAGFPMYESRAIDMIWCQRPEIAGALRG
jgi:hypothetical protein